MYMTIIDILSYEYSYMLRPRALLRARAYTNIVVEMICVGKKELDGKLWRERKKIHRDPVWD